MALGVTTYVPGQYLTVRVTIPGEEYLLNRQYSLSCAPGHDYYRISVKKRKRISNQMVKFQTTFMIMCRLEIRLKLVLHQVISH